jgi:two-component system cell cycle sensor histidine kinase/response regulator CckA
VNNEIIKGTGTILLVDDESVVIDVGKKCLRSWDMMYLRRKAAKMRLEIFSKESERIDLIILDMIMPGMDGSQTFDLLRDIESSIPVLLSSGYSLNGQANKIMQKGCNGFIQKPFLITQLSEKITQILDGN